MQRTWDVHQSEDSSESNSKTCHQLTGEHPVLLVETLQSMANTNGTGLEDMKAP